jgi:hypothetical protein
VPEGKNREPERQLAKNSQTKKATILRKNKN